MNARTIRRAQERRAAKQARKAALRSAPQIATDRVNTQTGTAPAADRGEAESSGTVSLNQAPILGAPKTRLVAGLTGRTVLLPASDAEAYSRLLAAAVAKWQPVGEEEQCLVQSLVDTEWRLMRIPSLEAGIYALGRLEFAENFNHEPDEALRRSLIEAHTFAAYHRQFNNLATQENRLRRQRQKDSADLQRLQQERLQAPSKSPEKVGFEFTTAPTAEKASDFGAAAPAPADLSLGYIPDLCGIPGVIPATATLEDLCGFSQ
jgi:hypothetical protein